MKNLITSIIEYPLWDYYDAYDGHFFDDIPLTPKLEEKERDWYGQGVYHKVGDYHPWDILERILKHYIGRKSSEAYTHYCSIVPKYQQHLFYEELKKSPRRWYYPTFYEDDQGILRKNKRKPRRPKPKAIYYSDDYSVERQYKYPEDNKRERFKIYRYDYLPYEDVVVSGYSKIFDSFKDREYLRLIAEQQARRKRNSKLSRKAEKEKFASVPIGRSINDKIDEKA